MPGRARSSLRRVASATAEQAVASGYVGGWRLVQRLPEPTARRLFDRLAVRVHERDGRAVRQLRANLRHVVPTATPDELERITRDGVRSYLRYWCESFRLPVWPVTDLVSRTAVTHVERLRTPYDAGRGVVSALPHMANWDWAGAWACGSGMPLTTVAERLRPERLYDEFVAYRESLGMRILPLTGGAPTLPTLADHLRAGGLVCLLADRDLGRSRVEVDLCGHRARMPAGPALLARETGAALLPTTLAYTDVAGRPGMALALHPEVPVGPGREGLQRAMQQVADAFTGAITAHPEDWHMMQPVFLGDPGSGDRPPGPVRGER